MIACTRARRSLNSSVNSHASLVRLPSTCISACSCWTALVSWSSFSVTGARGSHDVGRFPSIHQARVIATITAKAPPRKIWAHEGPYSSLAVCGGWYTATDMLECEKGRAGLVHEPELCGSVFGREAEGGGLS